jgi:hypothetical protein
MQTEILLVLVGVVLGVVLTLGAMVVHDLVTD